MFTDIAIIAIVFLICVLYMKRKKGERFPGPNGLPLVGNFLDFKGKNKVEVIQKYRQKYGDIFELRFLHKSIIVLSGYSTLKDALVKNRHVFSDRPFVEIKRLFLGSSEYMYT